MNNTISHPIGSKNRTTEAVLRDVKLLNRVAQNMAHEADRLKVELARRSNATRTLQLHAPCQ